MGYRSDVAIKMGTEAFRRLKNIWTEESISPDDIYKDGKFYIAEWEWMKWYEDYPEIARIMDCLDELEEESGVDDTEHDELKFSMVRIGEDYDDTEIQSNDCFYLNFGIVRRVCIPNSAIKIS